MENRINYNDVEPDAYKALLAVEKYIASTKITATHKNLIKIRASQINTCSYCIDMHTKEARKAGEHEQRIYALNAWRETHFFTDEERAILALTEEVTLITKRVSDATYNYAIKVLGEHYTAQIIMAIISINSWNRIGVATNMIPPND